MCTYYNDFLNSCDCAFAHGTSPIFGLQNRWRI